MAADAAGDRGRRRRDRPRPDRARPSRPLRRHQPRALLGRGAASLRAPGEPVLARAARGRLHGTAPVTVRGARAPVGGPRHHEPRRARDGVGRGAGSGRAHTRRAATRSESATSSASRGSLPRCRRLSHRAPEAYGRPRPAVGDDRRREGVGAPQPERAQRTLPAPDLDAALLRPAAELHFESAEGKDPHLPEMSIEGCRATAWGRAPRGRSAARIPGNDAAGQVEPLNGQARVEEDRGGGLPSVPAAAPREQ